MPENRVQTLPGWAQQCLIRATLLLPAALEPVLSPSPGCDQSNYSLFTEGKAAFITVLPANPPPKQKSMSIHVSQGTNSKQRNASLVLAAEGLLVLLLSWQNLKANPKLLVFTGAFPILPGFSLANNKCKEGQDHWLFIAEREILIAFLVIRGTSAPLPQQHSVCYSCDKKLGKEQMK